MYGFFWQLLSPSGIRDPLLMCSGVVSGAFQAVHGRTCKEGGQAALRRLTAHSAASLSGW